MGDRSPISQHAMTLDELLTRGYGTHITHFNIRVGVVTKMFFTHADDGKIYGRRVSEDGIATDEVIACNAADVGLMPSGDVWDPSNCVVLAGNEYLLPQPVPRTTQ